MIAQHMLGKETNQQLLRPAVPSITGFLQTKLRDVEDRLGEAHARIGRLEAFETETTRLTACLREASAESSSMSSELLELKKALKTARQQAVSSTP